MSRNITPRPIKAQGARDAHGRIFEGGAGSLYVHMHREAGLAHRHYVLKAWQVRVLGIATARPMLVLYFVAIASWGWLATQSARVPLLQREITALTADAQRLDTLTATLAELQGRYDHVQRLLSVASTGASATTTVSVDTARQATRSVDTIKRAVPPDSTQPRIRPDSVRPPASD